MLSPYTIIEGIEKLQRAVVIIDTLLPQVPKALADVQAVVAAKDDPAAEIMALTTLMADVQKACEEISALVKPPAAA